MFSYMCTITNVYDLHRYGFSRGSYKGACYDTNIGIAHQRLGVWEDGIKISIAGDLLFSQLLYTKLVRFVCITSISTISYIIKHHWRLILVQYFASFEC